MAEKTPKYSIPQEIIAKTIHCDEGMSCLETGPKCRVGATINGHLLVVTCVARDAQCSYFLLKSPGSCSAQVGVCTCPVRLSFRRTYGL